MAKYTEMTDDEIAVDIAKKLGYRVEFVKPSPKLRYPKWVLFNTDGGRSHLAPLPKDDDPDRLYLAVAHRYPKSADEALTLPGIGDVWDLTILIGDGTIAVILYNLVHTYEAQVKHEGKADPQKIARAICEAWLEMMDGEA